MKTVTVLGATGSIGLNTIDVITRHPGKYRAFALTGHSQVALLADLAKKCNPRYIVIVDDSKFLELKNITSQMGLSVEILVGTEALQQVSSAPEVDIVMSAIVGAAGLLPTLAAVRAGKRVLLANKESLVMSGSLFMQAVKDYGAQLLPIDSEHNAIFQCLPHDFKYADIVSSGITKVLLTGSGGPLLNLPLDELSLTTPDQACNHPNWEMGRKISVDSATMMNKGLEFIEAKWLFGIDETNIEVVIHPQSTIHSMVQYRDGSVIAQLGNPDMRTPIAYGLGFPERIESGVGPLNFASLKDFSFSQPEQVRFPNLFLAIECCKQGQSATTILNATNEIAVGAFLNKQIKFTDIFKINECTLSRMSLPELSTIQEVIALDDEARSVALNVLKDCA